MTAASDAEAGLASGERSAFHGAPLDAVAPLTETALAAESAGRPDELVRAAWLLGVALGALGRYGGALTVLSPLIARGRSPQAPPEARRTAALAAATAASVHRQLGRHAVARDTDLAALELAGSDPEAAFDAQLGLAADAVGLGERAEAQQRWRAAQALVPDGSGWWRQRVRLGWVRADLALLEEQYADALAQARAAVDLAEASAAPRHVAKGLLYVGLAQVRDEPEEAARTLARCADLAESLGTVPLSWPAQALLGALLAGSDPQRSRRSLAAAAQGVRAIAAALPPGVRAEWLARPDVAALLSP